MRKLTQWFPDLLALFVSCLPRTVLRALAWALGFLWWDIFRLRRFTIFRNLCIVFPNLTKKEKIRIARESLFWMGTSFLEFLMIPRLNERYLRNHVVFEGIHHYENARRSGKGVYFLSLHIGNGDLAVALMSVAGIPIHLISKKFKNRWINDFWFGVRERKGTRFIDPHGSKTPFEILKALGRNEVVTFVLDQFMGKPYGIETTFFGRKTGTAYGLALFAIKTKSPVLPVYTYRDEEGKTHVVFEEPIALNETKDRDLQIQQMTQNYNQALERIILKHPEQWMWVHRRWKLWE